MRNPDKPEKPKKSRLGKLTLQKDIFDNALRDNLKSTVDIVALFAHFGVKLAKKGKSYIGNCPWHDDSTPSLSVDKTKGLYNCFGCGESGDIFTLVEKMKGCTFTEAMEFLQHLGGLPFSPAKREADEKAQPVKSTEPATENQSQNEVPAKAEEKRPPSPKKEKPASTYITLDTIRDQYSITLQTNQKAQEYLKSRGISIETAVKFKIGYVDGSISKKAGGDAVAYLKETGIFTQQGNEHFSGCIVVPLTDADKRTLSFYGRKIDPGSKIQHLYLPGEHKAVFNEKAYQVYDSIILTESVIDALSLITIGIQNVSCIYGTQGLTKLHIAKLHEHAVREVVLALDKDTAGKEATEKYTQVLVNEGFTVKTIKPSGAKDWNGSLVDGFLEKEEVLSSIKEAESVKPEPTGRSFRKTDSGLVLTHDDMTYTVKQDSSSRLNVKCEMDGEVFYDRVDLVSSRSRSSFAGNVSRIFDTETKRIEKDLIALLEYYDDEKSREEENATGTNAYILSEEEKISGARLLQSPRIFEEILEDMETLGYVGEDENKLLVYLAGVSRLLPKPLSVFIQSPPSTGKSYLLETLLKLLPEESVEWITSMSDQAFNYMDKDDFLDKIFMLGEALHNETIEGYIRQMQSENRIARKVTMKDPKSGSLKTITVSNKARLVFMQTSAAMKANAENLSRCLVLTVDNSVQQTERVLEKQRYKTDYEGYLEEKHVIPEILNKHKSAQRLLQKVPIFNPYQKYIRFPAIRPSMRRAQGQFLNVMSASCLLRQMQKEPVMMKDHFTKREESVYQCDLVDYDIARRLFINGRLLQQDEEISSSAINLYESIRKMIQQKALQKSLASTDVTFIQKEVREITTLGNESIKRYLRILVEYEYLQLVGGKRHGTRFSYRLREDASIDAVDIATLIPTVEEIHALIETG